MKKYIRQVISSGEVRVRGVQKPLRLLITMDALSGRIVKVEKTNLPLGIVPAHPIKRRKYYETLREFLPRKKMTDEERKRSHVKAVQKHRRIKNVRPIPD